MSNNPTRVRAVSRVAVAPPIVHAVLASPGRPLDAPTREFFEPRFGHDFSQVRVHADARAADSACAIDAHAYTVGRDVVFGAGRYTPGAPVTRQLLAHELAHVVQQRGAAAPSRLCIEGNDEAEERQARRAERQLAATHFPTSGARSHQVVQRRSIFDGIAGLFRGDDFSDQELFAYLKLLDTTKAIEDYTESDNKARAVVRHWKRGDSQFLLPPARKILLIREMLSGFTGDDDEQAILDLLGGSPDTEFDQIMAAIGEAALNGALQGEEQDRLDVLLAARRKRREAAGKRDERGRSGQGGAGGAAAAANNEVFDPQTIADLRQRFTENSEQKNRLNCIEIIRDIAPRLLAADPELAQRVRERLAQLRGKTLTMVHLGKAMSELGLSSAYRAIKFNNQNGNAKVPPDQMLESAWDAIIGMIGTTQGWHVFGLAVFDGFHSVTVMVDNRPDGPRVYWADQWAFDPKKEDFLQEEGSVSGFRRYERAGFDAWLNHYTRTRWEQVFAKGKRYDATLHIWKFRSGLDVAASEGATQ